MKTKKFGILIGFLSLLTSNLFAQSLAHKWANGIGDKSNDAGTSICVDAAGNTYLLGNFKDSTDLDPSGNNAKLISKGSYDIFIAKYDINGNFIWGKGIGGTNADYGNGIGIDGAGYLYVTGTFRGIADFDPSVNTSSQISAGGDDIFIAKYDTNGNYYFSQRIGSLGDEFAVSIAVEKSAGANVYITGYFAGTVDFDPSGNTASMIANVTDAFIGKYSETGNFVWAKKIGGSSGDYALTIALDKNNNVLISGGFNGTVNFDPDGLANITSSGADDIFIAKYNSAGLYSWAISIVSQGGMNFGEGRCVKTDNNGNVYLTGMLYGTLDFDFSANTASLTSNGVEDIFVAGYDSNGIYKWAGNIGGSGTDKGMCLAVDNNNDIYLSGFFQDTVDFDMSFRTANKTSSGNADVFILKLSSGKAFKGVYTVGGTENDKGLAMAIINSSEIRLTGYFSGTVDFDTSSSNNTMTSKGMDDAFLLGFCGTVPEKPFSPTVKNRVCSNTYSVFSVNNDTLATNYQWTLPSGWTGYSSTSSINVMPDHKGGTISVKAGNSCGVSPSSATNVSVLSTDVTVSLSGTTLKANEKLADYFIWLNCDNNYSMINGENSQSYTPTVSGRYAVKIFKLDCIDTSICTTVYMTGIADINPGDFNIYPNPGTGKFKLTTTKGTDEFKMIVLNYLGQIVEVETYIVGGELYFELKSPEAGLYFVTLEYMDGSFSTKIISIVN